MIINSIKFRRVLSNLSGIHTNQLWNERSLIFEKVVANESSKSGSRVLEIGTWFGGGSTQIILKHLAQDGLFVSVDAWSASAYNGAANHASKSGRRMAFETLNAWISSSIHLFRSQKSLPMAKLIQIRSKMEDLAIMFGPDFKFDLIYIDGSHIYEDVLKDIAFAKQHISANGLICGDDLDLGLDREYLEIAKKNLDKDLVLLPNGNAFHPGVLLAVHENFKNVEEDNGFWWIRG